MKKILALTVAMAIGQMVAMTVHAQAIGVDDKAAIRSERQKQGAEAARGPQIGEGQPIPDAKPRVSAQQRSAARSERRTVGAEAARGPQLGEGDPVPEAAPKVSSTDRSAARKTRKTAAAEANKSGEIKAKGETSY